MIYPHIHSNVTSHTARIQQLIQHRKMSANHIEYLAAAKINHCTNPFLEGLLWAIP